LNRQRFEPPTIRTASDIKRVLAQLEPSATINTSASDVTLAAEMTGTDTENRSQKFRVSAKTKTSSVRDVLLEGLNMVKQREEAAAQVRDEQIPIAVDGKEMKSPSVMAENNFIAIDPVIGRTLGGYRCGHYIQWDLSDGFTYRYDIFVHRLTRFKTEKKL